jgi:PAS domain S-box-containing protein
MKLSVDQIQGRDIPARGALRMRSEGGTKMVSEPPREQTSPFKSSDSSRLSVWPKMLFPLTVTWAVVTTFCVVLYLWQANQSEKNLLDREALRMVVFSRLFERDLHDVEISLRLLSTGDGLQTYLQSGNPSDLQRAIARAVYFGKQSPDFDQIRFINEQGQETLRVNAHGAIVPPDQLQNKADRSYFKKTNVLAPGQMFISAFDLNVENGKIEQPLKPLIRFAVPVFDANGQRRGIYIINYLGQGIFDRLQKLVPLFQQRLRVLNAQGYWLRGARPEEEWGFMFPDRAGYTLAKTNPEIWSRIVNQPQGQASNAGGYLSWNRVVPREINANAPGSVVDEDDFLVFASEISPEEWEASFAQLRETFVIIAAILLILGTILTWFFQTRRRLRQERDRFFNLTRDMLCVSGFDGYFKRINPAWEKTLGYTEQELLSQPFLDFVHPDDREKTIRETASLVTGGESLDFENRYRCKDGSYRWLLWSARSLLNEKLIFASARDLTERKGIEEHVLKLNEEMKHRADLLEVANKELESFSYSVSHDLRAPLRHINGFVELLQKSPTLQKEDSSRRQMGIIARAAKEMGMLIDDLLAFSRTGRAEMHLSLVDMREIIDQIVHDRELENQGRKITWEIGALSPVLGDASLLRLVWTNLLDNALKYSRKREETKIDIGELPDDKKSVVPEKIFFVRDNGVGFDMQYAGKLFGVFQRLHRTEDFEGTGIGLANVQRIIHRHGGRTWGEGQLDGGATFYFSLPINPPQHM